MKKGFAFTTTVAIFGIVVMAAFLLAASTIISLLKAPLALAAAVLVFFYSVPFVKRMLDIGRDYVLLVSGFLALGTFYAVVSSPLFWITMLLGLLGVIYFGVQFYLDKKGDEVFDLSLSILRGEED